MRKLGYLWVSYRILERNFYNSAQSNGVEQHSEWSRKPSNQQWIFKKAEKNIIISSLLTWMIYQYVHKELQSYHEVFCWPKSVNTKRDNPMVHGTNFTQCSCTGYCDSWILSLLSFIMNSCYCLRQIIYSLQTLWWRKVQQYFLPLSTVGF